MKPEVKQRLRLAHLRRYSKPEYRNSVLAKNKAYSEAHPEMSRKRSLKWRRKNIERARANHRQWSKSEAGRKWYQARDQKRRAQKLAATINEQSIDLYIGNVRSKSFVTCYYCHGRVSGKKAHFDHIVPLSKGGSHSIENLCIACPHCNQSKHSKRLADFITLGQKLLEL